ncbi:DUF2163 domain-containing protein [Rhodobaculum claviforme]|uniref:Bacteriophage phiJL001 Gp84 C-terminal domain-containing protein n=1 Tax=Rhodobaculum claviforme TaxID=1549854 RepID=A0A934THW5_9RHOB|nr:DUF2163 domain-containing protein [Rhodobaculum claviforme]MBK5926034.1 hypothetical protein [Rhodobaculum claviforme]
MTLQAHLETGTTTIARAWAVTRRDGEVAGFTDHDRDLAFEGITFRARTALTASALQQMTGLGVDNTEAAGALSDAGLREVDILSGRLDGAEVRLWWVNWADVTERALKFRGWLGDITRVGRAFRAELLGLSEPLGRSQGRVYQAPCSAVLGDAACGVDVMVPALSVAAVPQAVPEGDRLVFAALQDHAPGWFARGRLEVLEGPAAGLGGLIKSDREGAGGREIVLWERLPVPLGAGHAVRLVAGCDKRADTCRNKFGNFLNFQGFPHIPGEDWMMAVPRQGGLNDGGSLKR